MKNTSLIINIVLAVAIAVLYVLHFTSKPRVSGNMEEGVTSGSIEFMADGLALAWVNMDSLLNHYDMYFDIQKDMEVKGRKMETDMNTRTRAFEKQMIDFQDKVQKGLVTRSQAQVMQQELAEKEQQLYLYRDELRMQFAEEEQVMLRRIQQSIYDYLKEYNKDKGYHIILSGSFGGPLLYGNPGIEITNEVLDGINIKYINSKSPQKK
jgi:outer membrane protein